MFTCVRAPPTSILKCSTRVVPPIRESFIHSHCVCVSITIIIVVV